MYKKTILLFRCLDIQMSEKVPSSTQLLYSFREMLSIPRVYEKRKNRETVNNAIWTRHDVYTNQPDQMECVKKKLT